MLHLGTWLSTVSSANLACSDAVLTSPADNKVLIVQLGGLTPLIRQMLSPNVEVQCNAVGCITNLATHEENKAKIARSGALGPLTRLAKSRDMRVQRNATGALLNMTHSGKTLYLNEWRDLANSSKMRTDSSSSMLAPSRFSCNYSHRPTSTFSTTAQQPSATSRSTRTTDGNWLVRKGNSLHHWSL